MNYIDSYNDICQGIEIHEQIIESMEEEFMVLNKLIWSNVPEDISAICYSGMPGGSSNCISFDRLVERMNKLKERYEMVKYALGKLKRQKSEIEEKIKELEGIEYKVAYMRDIEGKKLSEIAEALEKSEGYIKNISMKINKI